MRRGHEQETDSRTWFQACGRHAQRDTAHQRVQTRSARRSSVLSVTDIRTRGTQGHLLFSLRCRSTAWSKWRAKITPHACSWPAGCSTTLIGMRGWFRTRPRSSGKRSWAPFNSAKCQGTVAFSGRPTEEAPRRTRFAYAYETLRGAACNARNHRLEVSFDPNSLVTNVRASVQVQRPAADFRALADPRCWENRAKLFFKESRHCGLVSGDFETRANESPLVPRTYEGPLLEHVTLGFSPGFPLDAVNVLSLDCDPNGTSPTFTVSLHACLESLLGLSFGRGGLDVDGGTFLAEAVTGDPGWTSVSGTKAARFTERDLLGVPIGLTVNYFAPFCLAALMSVLVFEGACFV